MFDLAQSLVEQGRFDEAIAMLRESLTSSLSKRDLAVAKGCLGWAILRRHFASVQEAYPTQGAGLAEAEALIREARVTFPDKMQCELAYCLLERRRPEAVDEILALAGGSAEAGDPVARTVMDRARLLQAFSRCNMRHGEFAAGGRIPVAGGYLAQRLNDAIVKRQPFNHFYLTDVFPTDLYTQLLFYTQRLSGRPKDKPRGKTRLDALGGGRGRSGLLGRPVKYL